MCCFVFALCSVLCSFALCGSQVALGAVLVAARLAGRLWVPSGRSSASKILAG